jgi:hypothetical protein
LLCCRQPIHQTHGTGKTLDCSHGWLAPATFDACHHALGRAHACGHIALRQARLGACCNQFAGQLKLCPYERMAFYMVKCHNQS